MTLNDLVTGVATKTGTTKKVTKEVIDATFASLAETVNGGDQILIPSLGRFGSKARKGRKGTNLTTGEKLEIPAKKVPTFSYIKKVKETVALLPLD